MVGKTTLAKNNGQNFSEGRHSKQRLPCIQLSVCEETVYGIT